MKSYGVIKFGLLIATLLTILVTTISYFSDLYIFSSKYLVLSIIIFMVSFVASSLIFNWYLKQRIVKLYQMMDKLKPSSRGAKMQSELLKYVESDVVDWASKRKAEIDRLKETEKYRKEFIGNLAHELKTPVFSVQGYILTLLEGGLEDETINRKFLQKAFKGIERIATVIEDMDTITRIESGILELDIKRFNLVEIIHSVFYELEEKAKEKHIKLSIENKNASTCYVTGDQPKITQVIYNLVNNSINYGNENGETNIYLKTHRNKVQISVIDDGLGIEKHHHDRLFERFYRVEKSRNRNKGGSGIGLAIVKHIMEAHNESIEVESEVGKGTTFTFFLPKG